MDGEGVVVMSTTKKTPKARLDADKTAKPKTHILGRIKEGQCFGGHAPAFALEDTETGERTPLAEPVSAVSWCDKPGVDPNGKPYTHGSYNTSIGCPECRGVPMVRTDGYGNRDPNGAHWTAATAARDAQPTPPLDPDLVHILVGKAIGCLRNIGSHAGDLTPGQYQRLEALYQQLLDLPLESTDQDREPV
jgi:hypothetical protein